MITVKKLQEELGLKEVTNTNNADKEIKDGCCCDLLSWVMAKGEEGMAWVTVQTHLNVIAVACLHDFACVIIPENIEVPEATISKANEENITVFSSELTAYAICKKMAQLNIGE